MVLQVSIGQISDDDDEIIGSITSAALAVLSLQDGQQRPHSALDSSMSDAQKIAAGKSAQICTRPKVFARDELRRCVRARTHTCNLRSHVCVRNPF